jgi:hypothetical protein
MKTLLALTFALAALPFATAVTAAPSNLSGACCACCDGTCCDGGTCPDGCCEVGDCCDTGCCVK